MCENVKTNLLIVIVVEEQLGFHEPYSDTVDLWSVRNWRALNAYESFAWY